MNSQNVFLLILLVIVLGLGYVIYSNYTSTLMMPAVITPSSQPSANSINNSILNIPTVNTSLQEYKKYVDSVAAQAVATKTIVIDGGCLLSPAVVKVEGSTRVVTFKNNDKIEHTVSIAGKDYKISAESSKQVTLSSQLKGVEGYSCLPITHSGASGLLFFP